MDIARGSFPSLCAPKQHNPSDPGKPDVSKRFRRFEQPAGIFFFSFSSDRVCSPDYPLIHNAGQTHLNLPVCVSLPRTGYAPACPAALSLLLFSHFSFQISLRELDGDGGHVGIF